jgi:hypothetical protein
MMALSIMKVANQGTKEAGTLLAICIGRERSSCQQAGIGGVEGYMKATQGKVIHLYQRDPQEALERLNRITGLRFSRWPQSLAPISAAADDQPEATASALLELDPESGAAEVVSG